MQPDTLRRQVSRIIDQTNIETKVALHELRQSIATHLIENGMILEDVRDFLGHEFIDTTQIYTRITAKHLENL